MDINETDVIPIKRGAKKTALLMGDTKPRIMSTALKGPSRGKEFADFCDSINMPLMPWQKYIANDFLTLGSDGLYVRSLAAILVARQSGKTHLMAMRILFGLFVTGEMSIVAISSKRGMAEDTFNKVCNIIENNDVLRKQVILVRGRVGYRGNGKQHLDLKNGAKYEVCAATADGTRGKSANMLFIDELASITPEAWASAKPVTIAKPGSQIYVASNAGHAYSLVLNDLRDRALTNPSPTLGWYEFSAAQHCKPTDRKGWQAANPALGITITEAGIESALSTMKTEDFLREHLCMWVSSLTSPWPMGSWESCADITLNLPIGPTTYFAFDVAQSRRSASLVAGQLTPDGKIGVGLVDFWTSDTVIDELAVAAKINEWAIKYRPQFIAFDHYSTASIAARLTASNQRLIDVSGTAFWQASGDLLDAIVSRRIVHQSQKLFDDQMAACAAKTRDGAWRLVRRASAGDISGPIALAMIVHKMQEPVSIPAILAV